MEKIPNETWRIKRVTVDFDNSFFFRKNIDHFTSQFVSPWKRRMCFKEEVKTFPIGIRYRRTSFYRTVSPLGTHLTPVNPRTRCLFHVRWTYWSKTLMEFLCRRLKCRILKNTGNRNHWLLLLRQERSGVRENEVGEREGTEIGVVTLLITTVVHLISLISVLRGVLI